VIWRQLHLYAIKSDKGYHVSKAEKPGMIYTAWAPRVDPDKAELIGCADLLAEAQRMCEEHFAKQGEI